VLVKEEYILNNLQISKNKTLKLTNILIKRINEEELNEFNKSIEMMENYLRSKGTMPIGPLIQYTNIKLKDNEEPELSINIMRQTNTFIHNMEQPYKMESVIKVNNCMYCRYTGPEEKLKFAYDKINLTAFEEDIPLKGDSYTIFVDRNEKDDTITADVFMERAD
jgi:effector-binding domain-containing protein